MQANLCTSFSALFGSPSRTENGQSRSWSLRCAVPAQRQAHSRKAGSPGLPPYIPSGATREVAVKRKNTLWLTGAPGYGALLIC